MKKSTTNTILAPALSAMFFLSATGCETKQEREAVHVPATEMLVTYYDPKTFEFKQMDVIKITSLRQCYDKTKEHATHESNVRAICFNGNDLVGTMTENADGSITETIYEHGLLNEGKSPSP